MKILILGTGKTGTTALVYKVAGALPHCRGFSGGRPGKHVGDFENAVYKHTFEERKGKGFDLYRSHLEKEHYDRKIWMARDPRDAAVSRMLYRWHRGYGGRKEQFTAHLERVRQKEKDPRSIPFSEICRYTGFGVWPRAIEAVAAEEGERYEKMHAFVAGLDDDWFIFTYERMVNGAFEGLNAFLGFAVRGEADIPVSSGKAKVVRKKSIGDWRHWFTERDAALFQPVFTPYMGLIGYDADDWALEPDPVIEPRYASEYLRRLPRRAPWNKILRYLEAKIQRLPKFR